MYITIGNTTYTKLKGLRFMLEADVTGSKIPVNGFDVDIQTSGTITVGSRICLYDDLDTLWAKYWVTYADRSDEYTVHVSAQSAVKQLERDMLDPVMYSQASLPTVLASVLDRLDGEYTLDSSFSSQTITGFCPKQTARNRLQWICLVIGAYLKNFFNDKLEILAVDDEDEVLIPASKTYWKPKITYNNYVTGVRAYYYTYTYTEPETTDRWVEDANGTHYVEVEHQATLTNPNAPQIALENIVTVQNVTIINQGNVDDVLSHLAKYYFKRTELELDVINNGEFMPGQKVLAFSDTKTMVGGYIDSCSFTFGVQARASVHIMAMEFKESAELVIRYTWTHGSLKYQMAERRYSLPIGYEYDIENPYIDTWFNMHRYVFRPMADSVTGTMQAGGVIVEQPLEVALDYYDGVLHTVSVDEAELEDGTVSIS